MKNLVLLSNRNSKWHQNFQWNRETGTCCGIQGFGTSSSFPLEVNDMSATEFSGSKTGGSGNVSGYSWLHVRSLDFWCGFVSLNVRIVSLPWINTICNSLYRCARSFAAFMICHINPYSSVNVWRGRFRGPLGENMNGISRGNALKDE